MGTTRLTIQEQCDLFDGLHKAIMDASRSGTVRKGQAAFNYLHSHFPDLAREIAGTDADCFYQDRLIMKFFNKVHELGSQPR